VTTGPDSDRPDPPPPPPLEIDDGLIVPPPPVDDGGGEDEKVMTLVEHLSELRTRILLALGAIVVAACFTLFYAGTLTRIVLRSASGIEFIALTPMEVFFTQIKVGLIGALILAVPIISWQIWTFVRPGLKQHEMSAFRFAAPAASLLFVVGAAFAFFLVIPMAVKFLSSFTMEGVKSQYSLAAYTSFVLFLMLVMGLLFECPLVILLLVRLGLVSRSILAAKRRHIVLGCFIVAAVVTPTPDMVTQALVAVPMWILFELTLLFMK